MLSLLHDRNITIVTLWLTIWTLRSREDPTRLQDLFLYTFFCIRLPKELLLSDLKPVRNVLVALLVIFATTGLVLTCIALSRSPRQAKQEKWTTVDATQPLILRCRTTHTRIFPKGHSFGYRYLQVSVPVSFTGSSSRMLGVGSCAKYTLFHVDAADYLFRTSTQSTLEGKLNEYLVSQVRRLIYI
jgi:uncharacterized protein DUF1365